MFLRKGESISGPPFGSHAEVSGKQNILQFDSVERFASNYRSNGEHRNLRMPKNVFGARSDENLLYGAFAVRSDDDEIDSQFVNEVIEIRPERSLLDACFMRDTKEAP